MFFIIELEIVQEIQWEQAVDNIKGDITVSKARRGKLQFKVGEWEWEGGPQGREYFHIRRGFISMYSRN